MTEIDFRSELVSNLQRYVTERQLRKMKERLLMLSPTEAEDLKHGLGILSKPLFEILVELKLKKPFPH